MNKKHLLGVPDDVAGALGIRAYPGYVGEFTRRQAPGAIPNGSAIVKVAVDETGDIHPLGTRGIVLGSLYAPEVGYYYFVEWDPRPGLATGCQGRKISAVD